MACKLEQISENIKDTLAGVTTTNGYPITLNVYRAKAKQNPMHMDAVIMQMSPDRFEGEGIGMDGWTQPYAVVVYVAPLEGDTTAVDTYNNESYAAIYKQLMLDPTRGGLAIDTNIDAPLFFPAVEGEFGGITFMFGVRYRHHIDDPS